MRQRLYYGSSLAKKNSEALNRPVLEKRAEREIKVYEGADLPKQSQDQQGVATKLEEVVVPTNGGKAQQFLTDPRELALQMIARSDQVALERAS